MTMRIAYLVNQYPKVSHTFIRREIHALEARGFEVARFALRGWDADLKDPIDAAERQKTRYALQQGLSGLLAAAALCAVRSPFRWCRALLLAWRMSRLSGQALAKHLAYLAEACWLVSWLGRLRATHLHAHFGTNPAEVAMLSSVLCGVPYSFTVHGPEEFDRPQALGLALKIDAARFVVAVSSFGRSQLWRWASPAQWPKVQVVHCALGADYTGMVAVPPLSDARRLVCVGRLCEQKGQLLLITGIPELVRDGTAGWCRQAAWSRWSGRCVNAWRRPARHWPPCWPSQLPMPQVADRPHGLPAQKLAIWPSRTDRRHRAAAGAVCLANAGPAAVAHPARPERAAAVAAGPVGAGVDFAHGRSRRLRPGLAATGRYWP